MYRPRHCTLLLPLLCKAGKGTEGQKAKLLAKSLIKVMDPNVIFFLNLWVKIELVIA